MASAATSAIPEAKDGKQKRRVELRSANLAAWDRGSSPDGLGKLDTSLKRHTALLVKLRSSLNTAAQIPAILKDIAGLSLEKYVEEAVGAVVEGLGKCKTGPEAVGAVEVVSAFHQRFPVLFTPPFSALLLQGLKPGSSNATDKDVKEKEDNARVIKQRGLLRIVGELELVGVLRKENGKGSTGDVTWTALKDLLTSNREALAQVAPLAISFAKHLGSVYLPPIDQKTENGTDSHEFPELQNSQPADSDEIVSRETKEKFQKLLVAYFDVLGKKEQKLHLELQKQDKRNHEAYIRSGEVFEDREKSYEKAVKAWERGWASVTQLAELLGLAVPTLPSLQSTLNPSFVTSGAASGGGTAAEDMGPQSLWADEEEKKFYEDLRELRGEVPASILGVPEEQKPTEEKPEETASEPPVEVEAEEVKTDEEAVDEDELEAKKAEE